MNNIQDTSRTGSIALVFEEFTRRFVAPRKSVTFYAHLMVGIIAGSGLGIWNALYQCKLLGHYDLLIIAASLYTYFPTIGVAVVFDLTHEKYRYMKSLGFILVAVFLFLFFLSTTTSPEWRCIWGILSSILAVVLWWLVNGDKPLYQDGMLPSDAVGGADDRPAAGEIPPGWKS